MAIKNLKINKKSGYAILFSIIIISSISAITAGLLTMAYKQLILSSLANDSQTAFYQADMGAECALWFDRTLGKLDQLEGQDIKDATCGNIDLSIKHNQGLDEFTIFFKSDDNPNPCFIVDIVKRNPLTKIRSQGFNICNQSSIRALERSISIEYEEES